MQLPGALEAGASQGCHLSMFVFISSTVPCRGPTGEFLCLQMFSLVHVHRETRGMLSVPVPCVAAGQAQAGELRGHGRLGGSRRAGPGLGRAGTSV